MNPAKPEMLSNPDLKRILDIFELQLKIIQAATEPTVYIHPDSGIDSLEFCNRTRE